MKEQAAANYTEAFAALRAAQEEAQARRPSEILTPNPTLTLSLTSTPTPTPPPTQTLTTDPNPNPDY